MPAKLGKYQVGRTLGQGGSCKVKLGLDTEGKRKVAIKVMKKHLDPETAKLITTECEALSKLEGHQNILQIYEQGMGVFENHGTQKTVKYIVLELAQGGELFDFVAHSGRFEEDLARYYFKQFMNGLKYVHDKGITHRDLKPENLMLNSDFTLKIADFGFAGPIDGRNGDGLLNTNLGTLNYMAPEIQLGLDYEGKSIDIFAAAIILFIMVSEHPPFTTAQPNDPLYRCIAANRSDIFWQTHSKEKQQNFYSEQFQDLVTSMLHLEPKQRLSIEEILKHPWMQGDIPTREEVIEQFKERKRKVDNQIEQEKSLKKAEFVKVHDRVHRNIEGVIEEEKKITEEINQSQPLLKNLLDYEQVFSQNTEFFTDCNPDLIEKALVQHLQEQEQIEAQVNKKHYKLKFILEQKGQDSGIEESEVCIRILKVNDTMNCVEFTKLKGNYYNFIELYKDITKNVLYFANNCVNQ